MRRALLLTATLLFSAPLRAAEPAFTPDQRQQIIQIIRDALKNDPSILRDAVVAFARGRRSA